MPPACVRSRWARPGQTGEDAHPAISAVDEAAGRPQSAGPSAGREPDPANPRRGLASTPAGIPAFSRLPRGVAGRCAACHPVPMLAVSNPGQVRRILARLRRQTASGDYNAMGELGTWLMDTERDRRGRIIVARSPLRAFRLISRAVVEGGWEGGFNNLGYMYDVGLGTVRNRRQALYWYRRALRAGDSGAAANIATIYRDERKFRLMLKWWLRAAKGGDGDAAGDAAYCYQYGIGARRDPRRARRLYEQATRSKSISEIGRKEALYGLALMELDAGRRRRAAALLRAADRDGDYPEAGAVLEQIRGSEAVVPCRCRRFVHKWLPGHTRCPLHRRPAGGRSQRRRKPRSKAVLSAPQ